ncbi:MAG: hypothetical protein ACQESN_01565 [Thermotogota bacterium]
MKKSFFLIFLIITSLLFVSCSALEGNNNTVDLPSNNEENGESDIIYSVTFVVSDYPEISSSAIYVMGDFNDWVPGDEEYRMKKNNFNEWTITLEMPKGKTIEYQFNAGTYDTIEKDFFGDEVSPRSYKFNYDRDTINHEIENW